MLTKLEAFKDRLNEMGCAYLEDEPMKEHTTFRIGGPADLFCMPSSVEMIVQIIRGCQELELPLLTLGGGANLLVSDTGIRGVVLHTGGISDVLFSGGCEILCGAGVKLARACSLALEHSLAGLEFAWGIPGTCGGATMMNAGAYGGEMKDVLVEATHVTPEGELVMLPVSEMELSYRSSIYSKNNGVITSIKLRLLPGDAEMIRLQMDDLMNRRREKQPLEYPSAGSVFKRPAGHFAGTLIEECGLKGLKVGGAMVSEKHAGFIVNCGDATANDVRQLIETITKEVFLQTGVTLECEVRFVK